ncbi:MAG: SDR family oxidoreductase [Phototrophicales bacterium]|nr:SDR family oxidoreductase [Phototrophicales bacterium]
MQNFTQRPLLVIGGGTFLGNSIIAALLLEGAEVATIVRPDAEAKLGVLGDQVRVILGDVFEPASLRGRARGFQTAINAVGSLTANPQRGFTHQRLNFISIRNICAMCISDGVQHLIYMSSANAFWLGRGYIRAKRDAEAHIRRVGLQGTIIRAPLTYHYGDMRPPFFEFMTLLGSIPLLNQLRMKRIAPMPIEALARGVARVALLEGRRKSIYYAPDLRKLVKKDERRLPLFASNDDWNMPSGVSDDTPPTRKGYNPLASLDDDEPFGWIPPNNSQ